MKTAFHLDAGRKFFGKPALKTIIDTLAENGIEFFQLYLTDNQGFRIKLDDMVMTTPYGTYDMSNVPGDGYCEGPKGPCGSNKFHTQADMVEILAYG